MPTGLATPSIAEAAQRRAPSSSAVGRLISSDSVGSGGFTPGAIFDERYRIIGLLGRGGMGEVYRADDLKLGQPVALKFLPESFASDSGRLERFYAEVRIARQVSHPNVCRVYDVGERDGKLFLSMEYVDGEDLSTLLNRIGRLPGDKALEIARELCAGLAAAHDKGVLHRDLKPSNVMIDGRGRARITDFGLAVRVDEASGGRDLSGTPTYMAPEQFRGRGASVRTDLYALGLILYEMFTGRRAFDGAAVSDLARKHAEEAPALPSEITANIDPAVERVILNCLEKNPATRPASALQVAGALPGGDPLFAAIAAGETPSPAMVAAAGEKGGLTRRSAWAGLAAALAALVLCLAVPWKSDLLGPAPLEKPPEFLAERSREILAAAGSRRRPRSSAYGFQGDWAFLRDREVHSPSPDRWKDLPSTRPRPVHFWYRESPAPLVARDVSGRVTPEDPPEEIAGMAAVLLDSDGSLLSFHVVPPRVETGATPPDADWGPFFSFAGLDAKTFRAAQPVWAPLVFADRRFAWNGPYPGSGVPVRIEAASERGRPVSFEVVFPWTQPGRAAEPPLPLAERLSEATLLGVTVVAWVAGIVLARRNWKSKRGDRRGALVVGVYLFAVLTGAFLLQAHHTPNPQEEWDLLMSGSGFALFWGVTVWIVYLALEPYVRRRWPNVLISWTRLLRGDWRNPMVGRDVLLGLLFGAALQLWLRLEYFLPALFGLPLPAPPPFGISRIAPLSVFAGSLLRSQYAGLVDALGILFLLLLARVVLRRRWIALGVATLAFSFVTLIWNEPFALYWPFALVRASLWVALMLRVGLLASVAAMFLWYALLNIPIRIDSLAATSGQTVFSLLLLAVLTFLAFRISLVGRPSSPRAAPET